MSALRIPQGRESTIHCFSSPTPSPASQTSQYIPWAPALPTKHKEPCLSCCSGASGVAADGPCPSLGLGWHWAPSHSLCQPSPGHPARRGQHQMETQPWQSLAAPQILPALGRGAAPHFYLISSAQHDQEPLQALRTEGQEQMNTPQAAHPAPRGPPMDKPGKPGRFLQTKRLEVQSSLSGTLG